MSIYLTESINQISLRVFKELQEKSEVTQAISFVFNGDVFDNISSPFSYVTGWEGKGLKENRIYFNEIKLTRNLEIKANAKCAEIYDKGNYLAKINYYNDNDRNRLVKSVDWFRNKNELVYSDYYAMNGSRYKSRMYFGENNWEDTYYSPEGEVKLFQKSTGSIFFKFKSVEYEFENNVKFMVWYMKNVVKNNVQSNLIFSSLGHPLKVIDTLDSSNNTFFWIEEFKDDLPYNFKYMIDSKRNIVNRLLFKNLKEMKKFKSLINEDNLTNIDLKIFQFNYGARIKSKFRKRISIITYSDEIAFIDYIADNLSEWQITIMAPTNVSDKLLKLKNKKNINIVPNANIIRVNRQLKESTILLDINNGKMVFNSIYKAVEYGNVIMGVSDYLKDFDLMRETNIYKNNIEDVTKMVAAIKAIKNYDDYKNLWAKQNHS